MQEVAPAADSTSSPLTVKDAAGKFESRGLLTPQGHEERREPAETTDVDAAPSPEDSPTDQVEQSADADTDAQPEAPVLYAVPGPDGKETQVTLEELRGGYLRQADYTRKTQAIAEARKAAETEANTFRESRTQYQTQLGELKKALEALTPPEPDWAQLRRESPDEYAIRKLEWNDHQERIRSVKQAEQQLAWEQAQDQAKQHQTRVAEEQEKLLVAIPDWKDQQKAEAELSQMRTHAKAYGFSDAELAQVTDHRTVLLLRDAMRYRELQAKKPEAQKRIQQVKTATPGAQKTPEPNAAQKRALEQLAKSGKVKDAALAFQHRSAPRGD